VVMTENPQRTFNEEELGDPQLISLLDKMDAANVKITKAREDYKNAEKSMQALVAEKEVEPGTYRSGKWVLEISDVAAHQRVKIKLAKT